MSHLIRVCVTLVSSISLPNVFFYNQAGLTVQLSKTLLVHDKTEQQAGGANREGGVARAAERAEEPQLPSGRFPLEKEEGA